MAGARSGPYPSAASSSSAPVATNGVVPWQGPPLSPKLKQRGRPRKKQAGHVHWDERVIEEHNKERGTRQKIDEPDTPYVRSPQTASDSESNDDQHRLSIRPAHGATGSAAAAPLPPPPPQPEASALAPSAGPSSSGLEGFDGASPSASADVDPMAVASRLDLWMRSGGNQRRISGTSSATSSDGCEYAADNSHLSSACSSRSSSSAPHGREKQRNPDDSAGDGKRTSERRISLPEDSPQPKPTSDTFKAKRAKHYNEAAALKAFKWRGSRDVDAESGPESDTSDEDGVTKTNTNTNINTTMWKAEGVDRASSRRSSTGSCGSGDADNVNGGEGGAAAAVATAVVLTTSATAASSSSARPASVGSDGSDRRRGQDRSSGGRVSFSGGESGAESSEEFRDQRRSHYSHEWKQDASLSAEVRSLETNTNTNLNAGRGTKKSNKNDRNPMEAGRPPVRVADSAEPPSREGASEEFRAHRQHHYNEVEAVKKFRQENAAEEEGESSSTEGEVPIVVETHHGGSASSGAGNPMEPRETAVAFRVGHTEADAEGSGSAATSPTAAAADARRASGAPVVAGASPVGSASDWRAKRNAHYNEMAAALRSMPPPSDDEDSEDG